MARLSIRVKFNEGRVGVPLAKLGNILGEIRQFLGMLAEDVEIAGDSDWQGFDFGNKSLSFVASRPVEEKAAIVAGFTARFGAALEKGEIDAVVDRVLPLSEAAEAHRVVQASEHFGKVVLTT